MPFDSPYRDEFNGTKYIIIGRVGIKILRVLSPRFLGGCRHVISASRSKVETFNAYTLAYTRNFKMKKTALDSS